MGLAITRKLLHLMGSSIKLKSFEGEGSTFYFDLTLTTGETTVPRDRRPIDEVKDLGNARILAFDDLDFNLITLSKIIGKWNVQVTTAVNGLEAVEKVQRRFRLSAHGPSNARNGRSRSHGKNPRVRYRASYYRADRQHQRIDPSRGLGPRHERFCGQAFRARSTLSKIEVAHPSEGRSIEFGDLYFCTKHLNYGARV